MKIISNVLKFSLLLFVFCSCTKDVYQRPLLVNKLVFINKVGPSHEAKFKAINQVYLGYLNSIDAAYGAIVIDTTKQGDKGAYTFEATLQRKKLNDQFDLNHTIYFRPTGTTGPVDRQYGEMIYFTYDSLFFAKSNTGQMHHALMGPAANLMPTTKPLPPQNQALPAIKRFAVDSVTFSPDITKQQRRFFEAVLNNAFVVRQDKTYTFNILKRRDFNFYPNYLQRSNPEPVDYSINFALNPDPATDQMVVKVSYHGKEVNVQVPQDMPTELTFPLSAFQQGNYYEANLKLSSLVKTFISMQYLFD
jgi:hypothetical protein